MRLLLLDEMQTFTAARAMDSQDNNNRWATVTPDDYSGVVYIAAFLGLTYSSLTFLLRYFLRWRSFGLDDLAMSVAQIANLVQFSFLLVSLSSGLAQSLGRLSKDEYARMDNSRFGNEIAIIVTLSLSKLSTALLTRRLFGKSAGRQRVACNIVAGVVLTWAITAVSLVSTGCSREVISTTIDIRMCSTVTRRYKAILIWDAIIEVVLVIMPAYFCWQILISLQIRLQVFAVFAFRLPVAIITIVYLCVWLNALHGKPLGVNCTVPIVLQQCQVFTSLIAGTIPCLKSFLQSFDTGSGAKANVTSSKRRNSDSQRTRDGEIPLREIDSHQMTHA